MLSARVIDKLPVKKRANGPICAKNPPNRNRFPSRTALAYWLGGDFRWIIWRLFGVQTLLVAYQNYVLRDSIVKSQIIKRIARRTLLSVALIGASVFACDKADAGHHGHYHGYGHYYGGWGGYYGFGFAPIYTSVYSYSYSYRPYRPIINRVCRPWASWGSYYSFYGPSIYPSIYYSHAPYYSYRVSVPVYVAPTFVEPIYYDVPYCDGTTFPTTFLSTQARSPYEPIGQLALNDLKSKAATPEISPFIARNDSHANVPTRLVSAETITSMKPEVRDLTSQDSIRVVKPYTPVWSESAIGLIDSMIAEGDIGTALASCVRMEKIPDAKGSGVYLRHALFEQFDSNNAASPARVLDLLNDACAAGSQLNGTELPKGSVQAYLATVRIDVTETMNQLSRKVLESDANTANTAEELLLLAALLKLEGQNERAALFANEVSEQFAKTSDRRWSFILNRLQYSIN